MRLSSAAQPTADGKQPLTPGMGLKFLRDGIDSANLVSMNMSMVNKMTGTFSQRILALIFQLHLEQPLPQ